jgi:hypothetical protein
MNPLWFIVAINILALFLAPYLTYRYSHTNNLKVIREKWISELRDIAEKAVLISEQMYRSSDDLYAAIANKDLAAQNAARLERNHYYSKYSALKSKCFLLFGTNDNRLATIDNSLNSLQVAAENYSTNASGTVTMNRQGKNSGNIAFTQSVNEIIQPEWEALEKIQIVPFLAFWK